MASLKYGYLAICVVSVCALLFGLPQIFPTFVNQATRPSYLLINRNTPKNIKSGADLPPSRSDSFDIETNVKSVMDPTGPKTTNASMDILTDRRSRIYGNELDKPFEGNNSSNFNGSDESDSVFENSATDNEVKTILYWTKRYGNDWDTLWGSGQDIFKSCEFSRCTATGDKSKLKQANMLLFFHREPPNFPDIRYPRQLYTHYTKEPPASKDQTYLDEYEDIFNLTGNYRSTADIHVIGETYRPLSVQKSGIYEPRVPFKNRTKSVAWIVSNCFANSRRHVYVNELKKYIDVDIFGACGNMTCPKSPRYQDCYGMLSQKYKFYLAFENSICPGYVTEKPYFAIQEEMVPVVLGMPNYKNSSIAPPHSVIDVRDFKSPKDLAYYLNHMSEVEYNQYFHWKMTHEKHSHGSVLCELCKILHSVKYRRGDQFVPSYKSYGGYRKWWQDGCDNDLIERMRRDGGW